jgi:hypothetical protein
MVHWAYRLAIGCSLLNPLAGTACCCPSHLCYHCATRCFGGHHFDSCSLYTLRLLGCESRSCRNCRIIASGWCTCSACHFRVIEFSCFDMHPLCLWICFLHPCSVTVFGLIRPISSMKSARRSPCVKASIALSLDTSSTEVLIIHQRCMYEHSVSPDFGVQDMSSSVDAGDIYAHVCSCR